MKVAPVLLLLLLGAGAALWWLHSQETPPAPAIVVAPPVSAAPSQPAVPVEVLAALRRGVNISGWLQHGYENEPVRYAPDATDFAQMRALGLTHIRLPIDPAVLLNDRGLPKAEALARVREAVNGAAKEGLLTIVALQLPDPMKASLADEVQRTAFAGTWRALAVALRDVPPAQLVFEPLNEPGFEDAAASRALMQFLVTELRTVAPEHTLIVSGHKYSGIDELAALRPLAERNVVYGFHFYQPFDFTHQGANWGDPVWIALKGFPYPSSPEIVAPKLGAQPDNLRDRLHWYGEERWTRERLGKQLSEAAQWGKAQSVPVICSEFGVLRKRAAKADRVAWLRDVREQLEDAGTGWTVWDWSGPFGIVTGNQGKRVADAAAMQALGLGSAQGATQ